MSRSLVLVLLLLGGCVTDGPQRASRQNEPANVLPAKLVPTVSVEFVDSDANRYRDSTTLVVYVMGDNPTYHLPIQTKGRFDLSLEDPSGRVLATWRFDKEKTAAAMVSLQPGPGFVFSLDIRKSSLGTDVMQSPEAVLVVAFTPEKGELIRAKTSAPILIGPASR